jgi:hypothetical protein
MPGRTRSVETSARAWKMISWGLRLVGLRDPIPLPQRLRLLCATKRVERVGSDKGAVLCRTVVWPQNLIIMGKSFLAERKCFGLCAGREKYFGKLGARAVRVWMLGAYHLFQDRQRALIKLPCAGEVALLLKQGGEVMKTTTKILSHARRRGRSMAARGPRAADGPGAERRCAPGRNRRRFGISGPPRVVPAGAAEIRLVSIGRNLRVDIRWLESMPTTFADTRPNWLRSPGRHPSHVHPGRRGVASWLSLRLSKK